MSMDTYKIFFMGYRREEKMDGLPEYGGIYMVYRCVYNKDAKTVTLKELIYIGKSENIKERITSHDKQEEFQKKLREGEEICYSYASVKEEEMDVVENGLIYMQKPPLNSQYTRSFNYPDSHFIIEGRCALLKYTDFSIEKTD